MIITVAKMMNVITWGMDRFRERFPLEFQQIRDVNKFEWYLDSNFNVIVMCLDGLIVCKLEGKLATVFTGDAYIDYKVLKPIFYKETYFEPLEPYSYVTKRKTDLRSNLKLIQFIFQNMDITLNSQELSFANLYRKYQKENPRK